ncbi:MAG: S1C family serine protease [Thermaceae bacterium]
MRPAQGLLLLLLLLLVALLLLYPSSAQRLASPEEVARAQVIQTALPAIVRIQGTSFGEEPVVGTGFFATPGRIVTNYHVVRDLREITVRLYDGRTVPAVRFAVDPGIDLALLEVRNLASKTQLRFGKDSALPTGAGVVVLGNPFGQPFLASYGILSGRGPLEAQTPDPTVGQEVGEYLFTDAPLTVGNSGSPLLNLQGEVMGVVSDVVGGPGGVGGVGVAIPAELVAQSVEDLQRYGVPQRGWLGASLLSLDELPPVLLRAVGLTTTQGAMVDGVEGGPAARAGLRGAQRDAAGRLLELGDVILAINGKPVRNKAEVIQTIARHRPGDKVRLTLWRAGRRLEVTLTMIARPRSLP